MNKLDKGERFRGRTAHTLRLERKIETQSDHTYMCKYPMAGPTHVHVHANIHVHVRTSPLGSNKSTKVPAPLVRRYPETRKSHAHAFAMFNYTHIVLFVNTIENQVSSQWTRISE